MFPYRCRSEICYGCRAFVSKTSLNVDWEKEMKDNTFEADLDKLKKEAEDRLDTKITELMTNVEKAGQ
jgi:ferredoxin